MFWYFISEEPMKYKYVIPAVLLSLGMVLPVSANKIKNVFVVDELTVEVEMADPLTKEELDPARFLSKDYKPEFTFNEGVEAVGIPVPQKSDGFHYNVYRIAVSGLDVGPIYRISYQRQKPKTFKFYGGREQVDKYRDRYGSYF